MRHVLVGINGVKDANGGENGLLEVQKKHVLGMFCLQLGELDVYRKLVGFHEGGDCECTKVCV